MKSLFTLACLCAALAVSAQTSGFIKVPVTFYKTTKQWIAEQYRVAAKGGVVLYKESLVNCDNNYGCQSALPVTGLELTGVRVNNELVKLNWKTFTEINNRGFDVERKFGTGPQFSFTAFVPGSINSQTVKNYQLMDGNNYEGISYYRLKQTDIDGRVSYSNTVAVKGFTNNIGIVPYPNPARADNISFAITGLKAGSKINLAIHDNTGKRIYEKANLVLTGTYILNPSVSSGMLPGVYYVSLLSDNKKANARFVVIE